MNLYSNESCIIQQEFKIQEFNLQNSQPQHSTIISQIHNHTHQHHMDKLKSILSAKKPTTKVVVRHQQLEKKKTQYIEKDKLKKEQEEELAKKRVLELDQFYAGKKKVKTQNDSKMDIPLTNDQIKSALEKLYQPDKIQGELDQNRQIIHYIIKGIHFLSQKLRYKRLLRMQQIHKDYPQIDMKTFDQEFFKRFKEKEYFQALDTKYRQKLIEPKLCEDKTYREKKMKMILEEKSKDFQTPENFNEVCDTIYIWLTKILRDWKEKLDQIYSHEQKNKNNEAIQRYHHSEQEFTGLFKVLKNKSGDKEMIVSIYHIVNSCIVREYVQANIMYYDLSVGKAPWPMGVAMLGITVKKNAQRLSYVLNDEMTRKWVQGIKRLITLSQQLYPNQDKTKNVYLSVNSML